jgi:lipopolysaccharide/colanic/teichoic acid biosynthesis glycosyltransferase
MQSAIDAKISHHADVLASSVSSAGRLSGRRVEAWRQRLVVLALIFSDLVLALDVWGLVSMFHRSFLGEPSAATVAGIVVGTLAWIGLRALLGLYPGYGLDQTEELRRQTYALLAAGAITAISVVALQIGHQMSRPTLALGFGTLLLLSPLVRQLVKAQMIQAGLWGKPIVLIGSGEPGMGFARLLKKERGLGLRPVAVFDRIHQKYLARLVDLASYGFKHVVVISALGGITNSATVARDFAGTFGVEIKHNLLDPWARRVKYALDLCGVVAGGFLISPLLLLIAAAIKLDSPGPVFYRHRRLGARDEHFRCLKFRTMHADAERLLDEHLQDNPHLRVEGEQNQKLRDDPRVTRVGRFLRKTSLDELPQLWNVLRGEMSLVGPRPIVDAEVLKYGDVYALYKRIKPGMSGFWQVSGRSDTSYDERVLLDAYYVRNWSVWLDLVILARTVSSVMRGRGAH